MSVILKALKKLETDNDGKGGAHPWPDPVQARRKEIRLSRRHLWWLPALFALSAGAFFLLGRWEVGPQGHPPPAPDSVKNNMPGPMETRNLSAGPEPVFPQAPPSARPLVSPGTGPSPTMVLESPAREPAPPAMEKTRLLEMAAEPATTPVRPQSAKPDQQTPRVDDRRITLQAIAWSEDPARRFAVVNERIAREQQTIDGITLVRIEKNGICFREGGKEWIQPFYGRQQ